MSGKPAARQGDMTQYGGPIVRGFGRCKNWRANWRGVLGVPGRDDFGQPGKSAAGGEGAARRDGPCAARPAAVHSLPHLQQLPDPDACAGGDFGPGWKAPSDIRLQLRDDALVLNDNGGRSIHFEPLLPGRRCTAAASQCGWCAVVRQRSRTATLARLWGRCRRISG